MTLSANPSAPDQTGTSGTPYGQRTAPLSENSIGEDADVHASTDAYAARFGDTTGQWMLAVQEQAVLTMLDRSDITFLDVGGGHGQIAVPLSNASKSVTVLGSSAVCADRLTPQIENGVISFNVGNLLDLPYSADTFDGVVSFRLLSHSIAWRTLIAEMCRVARQTVIVDYPVWFSMNLLNPITFRVKKKIEGNTRTFRLFSNREVRREFAKHGFVLETMSKQFAIPMALHRGLKNVALSQRLESIARTLGVTRVFGSPVIAKFVRRS